MKYLGEALKCLVNLKDLKLGLCYNNLGKYEENLWYLGKGLK